MEARKLLFSLTITDDPDGDGIGTATATFGYVIPFIFKEIPDPTEDEQLEEEFDDEDAPWTTVVPATPPSGTFFSSSGIRLTYSTISTQPVILVTGNDTPPGGGAPEDDQDLQVTLTTNDSATFSFFETTELNPPAGTLTRLVTSAAVTIGGLDIDPTNGSKIELLRDGQVVATFRGAQLAAIRQQVLPGGGTPEQINQNFRYVLEGTSFDAFRVSSSAASPDNNTYFDRFYVDDITQSFPGGRFASFTEERIFGARIVLTGPIGASAEFLDLYGRQMVATIALGVPANSQLPIVDRNDDGVPDFNDGIGRINLTGVNAQTMLTMVGGTISLDDNAFVFEVVDSMVGLFDEMQQGGFGFGVTNATPPAPTGLPPGVGSIIIGSPFVRTNTTPGGYLGGAPQNNFTRSDQGIFVTQAGASMGSIVAHAALFGSSQFNGALGRLNVGYLAGSVTVQGDLGSMYVAGDAGLWIADEGVTPRVLTSTQNEIFVGRTAGEIAIGGRSLVDVTVAGIINDPARPALSFYEYREKEYIFGFDPATDEGVRVTNEQMLAADDPSLQAMYFGNALYRNDLISGAEYIGYGGTTVHIVGDLGYMDPVNTAEDASDVYAFSADGTTDVVVNLFFDLGQSAASGLVRIVDSQGRVVASHQNLSEVDSGDQAQTPLNGRFVFRPDYADVYYVVVNVPRNGGFNTGITYELTISGMAATTLGSYRTGAGNGARVADGFDAPNALNVASGNIGLVRIGTGYIGGDGAEKDTGDIMNPDSAEMDDMFQFRYSSITTAGNLYALWTGSDVVGGQVFIGGNLGSMITGQSAVIGVGIAEGDLEQFTMNVGGTIGTIFVGGAVGWNQDPPVNSATGSDVVNIRTGVAGGRGHIGAFLIGNFMSGSAMNLTTSPGSVIDRFIVGASDGGSGQIIGREGLSFLTQLGSDVRFVDFTNIEGGTDPNVLQPLIYGQSVTLSDDAGGTITVRITGSAPGAAPLAATSFGFIRMLPINGSLGAAIGRIDVTLNGGAVLEILGTTPGTVSIGRINVTTDGTGGSQILLTSSTTEIDVWRITQTGGALGLIRNTTPNGDLVAVDVAGLQQLLITSGNLGSTQTSGAGPKLIGPFLGVQRGLNTTVGGALGISAGAVDPQWNGTIFLPVNFPTLVINQDETLEDVGSPFDGYLNGLVVRGGNVLDVQVAGSVGDVILQGAASVLTRLVANSDGSAVFGAFDGIVGSIYAGDILNVDIGDGLASPGPSPFAAAGIFADDDIISVSGRAALRPVINGVILARNLVFDGAFTQNGLVSVHLIDGSYDGAFLGTSKFDEFWQSARFSFLDNGGDDLNEGLRGPVQSVSGTRTNFFRSRVVGADIVSINFTTGIWDASSADANGSIGTIVAGTFQNSTLLGEPSERVRNEILASNNIGQISANGSLGDISDLLIDAQGSLLNGILARNVIRADVQFDGTIGSMYITGDLRSTTINAGRLTSLEVLNDIRATSIVVAGPITTVNAGSNITNTRIVTSGPDGRIDTIRARFYLTGEIISSGAVTLITSTEGDIIGSISTTAPTATVATISAGRDMIVDTDFASDVNMLTAGRHIGQLNEPRGGRVINVRGNLNTISAPNGQIYTDVRVAESITGVIRTGRVVALPGNDQVSRASIVAYGRIASVDLHGDLNGSIISESGGIGSIVITDGSFRPGNVIRANDGSIDSVRIVGGHLLGDIIAEEAIGTITLAPNAAGFWGDMGITGWLSQFNPFDSMRNQLPPGVQQDPTFQGPRIQAGTNITLVDIQRGGMWESSIVAGHSIGRVFVGTVVLNDYITPGLGGSFIVAGDTISNLEVNGFAGGLIVAAGVTNLGADNRPGGTGANTDTVQFGRIGDLIFRDGTGQVTVAAGMNAGADGVYTLNPGPDGIRGTGDDINDDSVANGLSWINSVTVFNGAQQMTVYADNGIGFTSEGIIRGGPGLHQAEPNKVIEFVPGTGQVPSGGLDFTTTFGETGRITLTGPGQAYFEQVFDETLGRMINRLALINTSLASRLTVDTSGNRLTDFKIISNDSASLGYGSIRADLFGASSFYYDGYVDFLEFGRLDTTGSIGAGNDIQQLIVGPTTRGTIDANHIQTLTVGGDFGMSNTTGEAAIRLLSGGFINIFGAHAGLISIKRDVGPIQISGQMINSEVRAGRSIGSLSTTAMTNVKVSAGNNLGAVNVAGNVSTSSIYAGTDLGADGTFGGVGENADLVSNGNITSVTVGGNFVRSDIAAGVSRGADNFLGTADDVADEGHSSIGAVNISGVQVGSNLNSESYRIVSNGSVGSVRLGANPDFQASGNFRVSRIDATPDALQIKNLRVTENAGVYTAFIDFNQPVVISTISPALNIFEVRDSGTRTVRLAENVDFTVSYNAVTNSAVITFSQAVTQRNLPQQNGVPGPGVYRFTLDAAVLRGQTQGTMLDGNGNGVPQGADDDYSEDTFVGDVGDKIDPDPNDGVGGVVLTGQNGERIDYYFPGDLDLVLDNNHTPDGLPDVNRVSTISGSLGDHPDHNTNFFSFAADYDVFKITLRAGQILRLGKMGGVATLADRQLMDANGNILSGNSGLVQELPAAELLNSDPLLLTPERQFLIQQTGVYYIVVASPVFSGVVTDLETVPPNTTTAGAVGSYNFTIEIFDDGDTGFNGDTDSGNGVAVVNAPTPSAFAGSDNQLNTGDDLGVVVIGAYQFLLDAGGDGIKGTADDFVSGTNGIGLYSQRTSGNDGVFGTSDDAINTYVDASIGRAGSAGVPNEISPDADAYILNNGNTIQPGTRMRAVLKLTEFGSNLGLTPESSFLDLRGTVQFAIFDITNSTGISDGDLVAAPGNVIPIGGQANQIQSDGVTSYGFDANGDFFIDFIIPAHQGNQAGRFALYVQGSIRTDYQLQITTQGTGTANRTSQNVYIETRGGVIDWLEVGGITTDLDAFRAAALGFTGLIDGQTADSYILNNLIATLQDIFSAANIDINVSTDSSAFQGQDFSTIFLAGNNEPLAFFNNGTFGASEHSDAFNVDHNDQGVVFVPSLGTLGYTPSRTDVDAFTQSLSAAVARRVGELVGLRMLDQNDAPSNDVMAADSVRNPTSGSPIGGPFRFTGISVDLSPVELSPIFLPAGQGGRFSFLNEGLDRAINTDFFLGQQNSRSILDRLLLPSN